MQCNSESLLGIPKGVLRSGCFKFNNVAVNLNLRDPLQNHENMNFIRGGNSRYSNQYQGHYLVSNILSLCTESRVIGTINGTDKKGRATQLMPVTLFRQEIIFCISMREEKGEKGHRQESNLKQLMQYNSKVVAHLFSQTIFVNSAENNICKLVDGSDLSRLWIDTQTENEQSLFTSIRMIVHSDRCQGVRHRECVLIEF